ncbi:MAG: NADH-quinone oxidoreductase subunit N [bacterium]
MNVTTHDLWYSAPLIALTALSLVTLLYESGKRGDSAGTFWLSLLSLGTAFILSTFNLDVRHIVFGGMILAGGYANYFNLVFLSSGIVTLIFSRTYFEKAQYRHGELYVLLQFAIIGMMLMAAANDLMIVFLGIELMSVCLYILAGFLRKKDRGNEAALKYFLLGAFATGFLLYGIALVYGTAGTTNFDGIAALKQQLLSNTMFVIGAGMLVIAFAFKVSAVPFHMWAPDVYEGAPTPITAFMATGAKAAAFSIFVTVFIHTFAIEHTKLNEVIAFIAAASMVVGNIIAIAQTNIKRMLAYSSIAHAGYMLSGIAAGSIEGEIGVLFYVAAYTLMNVGAFAVVSWLEGINDQKLTVDDYAGLSTRQPLVAALMAIFLFSLAGIPPFAGFFGKYYVFLAAVKADMVWLAIVGVLASLVSVYYYLRIVVLMYFREGSADIDSKLSVTSVGVVTFLAVLLFLFGLFPSLVVNLFKGFPNF